MIAEPLRSLVVPIDSLNLDPANARLHPERNLDAIKGSLSRFGQRKPIIVRANGRIVMAGNGLLTAAKALGWTEIAAVVLDDDAITATAFAIADNRTADLANWDAEVLIKTMESLSTDIPSIDLGFLESELDAIKATIGNGFEPVPAEDQSELDSKDPIVCPECGHEFTN